MAGPNRFWVFKNGPAPFSDPGFLLPKRNVTNGEMDTEIDNAFHEPIREFCLVNQ